MISSDFVKIYHNSEKWCKNWCSRKLSIPLPQALFKVGIYSWKMLNKDIIKKGVFHYCGISLNCAFLIWFYRMIGYFDKSHNILSEWVLSNYPIYN